MWTLGTAFSGMESVGFALRMLGVVNYKHAFIIEKNQSCRKFVLENFAVESVFEDITQVPGKLHMKSQD